jgi:hypothetical protein
MKKILSMLDNAISLALDIKVDQALAGMQKSDEA